jgi:phosphatidylserine/phosphatidylglycerophosphate/cardiolipin synthase-like enzyme
VLVVLPAKPNNGQDDTRGTLAELAQADGGSNRLLACTLYARSGAIADPIYVHAKIAIVDDRWLTIGSANLNEHSLFNDTEMNLVAHDPVVVRDTRDRVGAELHTCFMFLGGIEMVDQEPTRTRHLRQASGRRSLVQKVKEMRSRWRLRAAKEVLAREAHSRAWERQKADLSKTNRKFTGPHPPPG